KETGTEHWNSPNEGATNESGFTALPGGYRFYSGIFYSHIGNIGYFWSSSDESDNAWRYLVAYDSSILVSSASHKTYGHSIRCVKDATEPTSTIYIPADYPTIQAGIDASSNGDTILVSAGTYVENINFNGKNIVVQGEDRETTIIDGDQNGSVVTFFNAETEDAILSNFTISNGYGDTDEGGGIHVENSSPFLSNLIITSNNGYNGGGIWFRYSNSNIENINIFDNTGRQFGGGIWIQESEIELLNLEISNNISLEGGGIEISESTVYINDSEINNNISNEEGGGIYIWNNSSLSLNDCLFLYNSATLDGGGIYSKYSNITINNSTIANNTSDSSGGGIYIEGSDYEITNSILWNNSPLQFSFIGNSLTVSYSDIEGGWEGDGNIDADPLFCDDENDDYHLAWNSPCVGTGQGGANMGAYGIGCEYHSNQYIVWTEGGSGNTKIYHFDTDTWETISSPGGANGGYIDMTYDIESDRIIWVKGSNGQARAYDFNTNIWEVIDGPGYSSNGDGLGMAYDIESDRVILVKGEAYAYDYNTDSWEGINGPGGSNGQDVALTYDEESDRIIFSNGGYGSKAYDYNTDTWEDISLPGNANGDYLAMTYNAKYDKSIWLKADNGQTLSYDYNTDTYETIETPGGNNGRGIALAYDSEHDKVFWISGNDSDDSKMYYYNLDLWEGIAYPGGSNGQDIAMTYRGAYIPYNGYSGPTWHVSVNGSNSNDGSLENPFATIQYAINQTEDEDTVLVHPGTYNENINFYGQKIVVGSEFITTQDTSFISQTIIDGVGLGHVCIVTMSETDSSTEFSGFTVRNGDQHGIFVWEGENPKINNLIVNEMDEYGLLIYQASPLLENLVVKNCNYEGLYLHYSNTILNEVTILNSNGALNIWDSNLEMFYCLISNNNDTFNESQVVHIGGDSNVEIYYSEISNNSTNAIWVGDDAHAIIHNSTIVNNSGRGIYLQGHYLNSSSVTIVNSIIWGHTGEQVHIEGYSGGSIQYSTIQNGEDGIFGDITYSNNIETNPHFIDPDNDDFYLQITSPCIDAGYPESDYDPDGTIADMGAYYFDQIETPIIYGCMDEFAVNYNPEASIDDGSCEYINSLYVSADTLDFGLLIDSLQLVIGNTADDDPNWVINEDIDWLEIVTNRTLLDTVTVVVDRTGLTQAIEYQDSLFIESDFGNDTVFVSLLGPYGGPVWYVATDGSDENNGSEENPFATIQHGIYIANVGDTVLVQPGTYYENLNCNKDIIIKSISGPSLTIIDGNQVSNVIDIENTMHFDGFTITNGIGVPAGNYFGGNGIKLTGGNPILSNLIIDSNVSSGNNVNGAGIWSNTSFSIENSIISNNTASNSGGGVFLYDAGDVVFDHCLFINNQSTYGSALYAVYSTDINLENCTVYGTNDFVDGDGYGGGIISHVEGQGSNDSLVNSIIWGDYPHAISLRDEVNFYIAYSDVQGGEGNILHVFDQSETIHYWLEGNINSDPLFTDPDNGDFTLQSTSPCIDTGDLDLDGDGITWENDPDDQDIYGSRLDMGAFPAVGYSDILAPDITSVTHPFGQWVSNNSLQFSFSPVEDAMSYLYAFEQDTLENLNISNGIVISDTSITFENIDDGIWFLSVRSIDSLNIIGQELSVYQTNIDTYVGFVTIYSETHSNPETIYPLTTFTATWEIEDSLSGINQILYALDQVESTIPVDTAVGDTLTFSNITDGDHYFHLMVTDNAENQSAVNHFPIHINTPPEVSVLTESSFDHDVLLNYEITDVLDDNINLEVFYSINHGNEWIFTESITGNINDITSENYSGELVWNSNEDIPNFESDSVLVSTISSDFVSSGDRAITEYFHLDNNETPTILLTQIETEQNNEVEISFNTTDPEDDDLEYLYQYSVDNIEFITPSILNSNDSSITWDSSTDLTDFNGDVYFSIKVSDNDVGQADTISFSLDNYQGHIGNLLEIVEEQTWDIEVNYELIDITSDTLDISLFYSLDGLEWSIATVEGIIENLSVDEYTGSIIWHSGEDIPGIDNEELKLKLSISDGWEENESPAIEIHIDNNEAPSTEIVGISGEVSGTVPFMLRRVDEEDDALTYFIDYSIDGQSSWLPASIGSGRSIQNGRVRVALEDTISLNWLTLTDIPNNDISSVYLRAVLEDNDQGLPAISEELSVDNYHSQSISINTLTGEQTGDISIEYTLVDTTEDGLNILAEYSLDNGDNWLNPATTGETTDIMSSDYSGAIVWHSMTDLQGVDISSVQFRITPSDNWANSNPDTIPFHLDNNLPPTFTFNPPAYEENDSASFSIVYTDVEEDSVSFVTQYRTESSSWQDADIVFVDSPQGESHIVNINWLSLSNIGYNDENVSIKVSLSDNDLGDVDSTDFFNVDNYQGHSITISDITGEQENEIEINYQIQDITGDELSILLQGSIDAGQSWNTILTQASIGNDQYVGTHTWESYESFPGIEQNDVIIRGTVFDQWAEGIGSETEVWIDNNLPPVGDISTEYAEVAGDKTFTIDYSDSEGDDVTWDFYYSVDFGQSWDSANVELGPGYITWHSLSNIPDYESDGLLLKAIPFDNDEGEAAVTEYFAIDNDHSTATLNIEEGEYSSAVLIPYTLSDMGNDTLSLVLEFFYNSQWHISSTVGNMSAITDYEGSFQWVSQLDLNNVDIQDVKLRLIASDEWASGYQDTSTIHLDNEVGPQLVTHTENVGLRSPIEFEFDLPIADSDFDNHFTISSLYDNDISNKVTIDRLDNHKILQITTNELLSFTSLDTLSITIHNTLLDTLGKGFDGDGDGDPEFSEVDDKLVKVPTQLLSDYDTTGVIDIYDLN
ncbi:MAG: right-handed parallel beta-helix repeat-containing protein, partial [Candidatus Marinimicrobia bacterium]|nr:right-handed parallel beta-helix repeat-containing protein [Candidatus Neomarinimicrobiota bacterium]